MMRAATLPHHANAQPAQARPWSGRLARFSTVVPALAALKFAVTLALSGRYGYHRDELYYLAAGRHLSFGYVDFPPITPLLARIDTYLFGTSLVDLRLVPALA